MNHSYIYVYIFFVFLSFFELNDTNRARCDLYYAIQVIVLLLTMGLSYQIGVDWVEYERVYNGNSESLNNYEFGYIVLNNIANYLWASFWGFVGNDSNLLIVFYVQIMPDDFVMQLHRF